MPIDKNADTPDRIRRNFQRLAHSHSYGEVPTGAVDSVNTDYVLAFRPVSDLAVFKNGLRLTPTTDYTVAGKTVTLASAPTGGDILLTDYIY